MSFEEALTDAAQLIDDVLNLVLNRHVHKLKDYGFLKQTYSDDYGYRGGQAQPALLGKWEVMKDVSRLMEPEIADLLQHPHSAVHAHEVITKLLNTAFGLHSVYLENNGYLNSTFVQQSKPRRHELELIDETLQRPFISEITAN